VVKVVKAPKVVKVKKVKSVKESRKKPRKRKGEDDEQFKARFEEWAAGVSAGLPSDIDIAGSVDANGTVGREVGSGEVSSIVDTLGASLLAAGCNVGPSTSAPILRWCRVQPFLPNSPKQILAYLHYLDIPAPKSFKDKDKETTAKDELKKLARKYPRIKPLIDGVIDYKEFTKVRSTYIAGWKAEMVDPVGYERPPTLTLEELDLWDKIGFVHPTFVPWPATGQVGARNPNSTNVPAPKGGSDDNKSKLAKAIRRVVEAKPGYVLIDFDWSSFHALTLGFNALDKHYMWISRRDVHSFITGNMLKVDGYEKWTGMLEREDEELVEILRWWKKSDRVFGGKPFVWHRNKRGKPGILGIGFGLGANKLWLMNDEAFVSRKDAAGVIDMIFGHFHKLRIFQNAIREKAYEQKFLLSPHGYLRWFWDVYHWQRVQDTYDPKYGERVVVGKDGTKYKQVWGEDSEAAIAFLPANNAFGHKHDCLWAMEEDRSMNDRGLLERYGWCNDEHDGLKFHCQERLAEECMWKVKEHMEVRSKVLVNEVAPDGLWCGVEMTVGRNWRDMEEIRLGEVRRLEPLVVLAS
jgi:hypothetical protein